MYISAKTEDSTPQMTIHLRVQAKSAVVVASRTKRSGSGGERAKEGRPQELAETERLASGAAAQVNLAGRRRC